MRLLPPLFARGAGLQGNLCRTDWRKYARITGSHREHGKRRDSYSAPQGTALPLINKKKERCREPLRYVRFPVATPASLPCSVDPLLKAKGAVQRPLCVDKQDRRCWSDTSSMSQQPVYVNMVLLFRIGDRRPARLLGPRQAISELRSERRLVKRGGFVFSGEHSEGGFMLMPSARWPRKCAWHTYWHTTFCLRRKQRKCKRNL